MQSLRISHTNRLVIFQSTKNGSQALVAVFFAACTIFSLFGAPVNIIMLVFWISEQRFEAFLFLMFAHRVWGLGSRRGHAHERGVGASVLVEGARGKSPEQISTRRPQSLKASR